MIGVCSKQHAAQVMATSLGIPTMIAGFDDERT